MVPALLSRIKSSLGFKSQIYTVSRSPAVLKAAPASSLTLLSRNPQRCVYGISPTTIWATVAAESLLVVEQI